jgi:hypothetical protein
MPNCPRCRQEIKSLLVRDVKRGELILGADGKLQAVDYSENSHQHFSCPKCLAVLETLDDQPHLATRFLKTGKMF